MSFILDAIAKSERERQQQEIPDARVLAIPADDTSRSRRNLSYLLIAGLLLIIILLIIWMQTGRPGFNADMQSKFNVDESLVSGQTLAEENLKPSNNAPSTGKDNSLSNDVNASTSSLASQSANRLVFNDSVTRNREKPPNLAGDVDAGSEGNFKSMEVQNIAEDGQGDSNTAASGEINSQSEDNFSDSTIADQASMPGARQPASPDIYRLRDLPDDVRRDLPSVVFKGHLYSKNPNVSYVMVDGGRSVVAGQQIANDVLLHEVTPEGVIVDFRGFLIEIGILQNWSLK